MSITQTTELGTLYTPAEVRAIADWAHEHGMALHMDGARLWNAAAALGVPFREFTADALVARSGEILTVVPRWREETKAGISVKGTTFDSAAVTDVVAGALEAVGLTDPWVAAQRRRLSAILFG